MIKASPRSTDIHPQAILSASYQSPLCSSAQQDLTMGNTSDEEANGPANDMVLHPLQIEISGEEAQSLPPADRGRDAWLALAGCFVLEMLVWGYVTISSSRDTYGTSSLTLAKLPLRLRRLPGLLLHARTFRQTAGRHSSHRHDRVRDHVPCFAACGYGFAALALDQTAGEFCWHSDHGRRLDCSILQQFYWRLAGDTGSVVCDWRADGLFPRHVSV